MTSNYTDVIIGVDGRILWGSIVSDTVPSSPSRPKQDHDSDSQMSGNSVVATDTGEKSREAPDVIESPRRSTIHSADGGDMEVIVHFKKRLAGKQPPKWLIERSRKG